MTTAAPEFTTEQARRMRWSAQLLGGSTLTPAEVVARAVALQGQELASVLRAIALRSRHGTTVADVRAAFDAGELVRSWPMRGTLFATTPQHLATLRYFTARRIHDSAIRRREALGLDDGTIGQAREALRAALALAPLTRAAALEVLEGAGIPTAAGRGYHVLMHLSVDGLAHWGRFNEGGGEQLLTLSTTPEPADPEAALAGIVRDYVVARGPVGDADLAWWTKLPKATLRRAASTIEDLAEVRIDGAPAWMVGEPPAAEERVPITLVPGFDEWILGYADRSFTASPAMLDALVPGGNGVFRPAVLVDGVTVGTWRLARSSSAARAAAQPVFEPVERIPAPTRRKVDKALAAWPYG